MKEELHIPERDLPPGRLQLRKEQIVSELSSWNRRTSRRRRRVVFVFIPVVSADGRDPTVICAEIWQHGDLPGAPVPEKLAACVLETGAIGVFPSSADGTCQRLGLAELPASYAKAGKQFAALRDAIVARLGEPASGSSRGGPQCVGEEKARAVVRRELDLHGYGNWTVKIAGGNFSADRPCADVSFDSVGKAVILVAVAPRG